MQSCTKHYDVIYINVTFNQLKIFLLLSFFMATGVQNDCFTIILTLELTIGPLMIPLLTTPNAPSPRLVSITTFFSAISHLSGWRVRSSRLFSRGIFLFSHRLANLGSVFTYRFIIMLIQLTTGLKTILYYTTVL